MATSLVLFLLYWQWEPMPGIICSVESEMMRPSIWPLCAMGWLIIFASTPMIGHFDLFVMKQVWDYERGPTQQGAHFRTPGFYKVVRDPIQLGFLIAFWAPPDMSEGRLLFAVVTTLCIVGAVKLLEERDFVREFAIATWPI